MAENAYMAEQHDHKNSGIMILLEEYISGLEARGYSAKSIDSYRRTGRAFAMFLEARGRVGVLDITAQDITDYRLSLLERGLKQNSMYCYLRVIRYFFRYLHEQEHIFENPADGMILSGPDRHLQPVPTEEEIGMLLALPDTGTAEGVRDRAIIETMYSTAVRREEAVRMNVADVDLALATVRIRGKGGHERMLPLGRAALAWLKRYIIEARDELRNGSPDKPALWLNCRGGRLSGQLLHVLIKTYARSCPEIRSRITSHSLRRACATHMLRNGANPLEIQLLLGHADLTHLRDYLRVSIRDLKDVHAKTRLGE